MRALRAINPWTSGALLLVAVLLGITGVLQLTRALPKQTVIAPGSVFGSDHTPGGRYRGESWEVYLQVRGHGSQIAYSRALYEALHRPNASADPAVIVHMRGALVTQVDLEGRSYRTAAVSSREAWIEAIVLLAFCALTLAFLFRAVARGLRGDRAAGSEPVTASPGGPRVRR
jgi:hypothetical protein